MKEQVKVTLLTCSIDTSTPSLVVNKPQTHASVAIQSITRLILLLVILHPWPFRLSTVLLLQAVASL